MDIYRKHLIVVENYKQAQKALDDSKIELYTHHLKDLNFDTGTANFEEEGYKIKIVKKESVTVDQTLASVIGVGFSIKYALDKTAYKKLDALEQKRVNECLTHRPSKPTFTVEKI